MTMMSHSQMNEPPTMKCAQVTVSIIVVTKVTVDRDLTVFLFIFASKSLFTFTRDLNTVLALVT
jgi:F0F1-type ATP synthase beta subunit